MASTRISGRFLIRNATIELHPAGPAGSVYAAAPVPDAALSASRLSVGAELALAGRCEVTGGIDMSMADVSRFSIGAGCALRAPGRTALDLTNAEIRAFLRLDKDADIEGTVRLAGAVSHGTLALHGHLSQARGRDPDQRERHDRRGQRLPGRPAGRGRRASPSAAPGWAA